MPTYRINVQQAITMIKAFVNNPVTKNIATTKALGGTLNVDSLFGRPKIKLIKGSGIVEFLQPPTLFNGNMAWFCWNDFNIKPYAPFFLAFETNDAYETEKPPIYPDMRELLIPQKTFTYEDGVDIGYLLGSHKIDPLTHNDIVIPRSEVMQFVQNFSDRGPKDSNGSLNKFPFGFFENEMSGDIMSFYNQKMITHFRYYFGLDEKYIDSNRIRIILIPVGDQGQNIFNDESTTIILQHSWPPPPPVQ